MGTTLITPLFRLATATAERAPLLADHLLFPDELATLTHAVPKRRAEYASGRVAAREALAQLGFPPSSLTPRADRCPAWPKGSVGSISHTAGYCAVVAGKTPPLWALGLDVERVVHGGAHLLDVVMLPSERRRLHAIDAAARDRWATQIFSAKEAFYKCQFPVTGTELEFTDVEVHFGSGAPDFEVDGSPGSHGLGFEVETTVSSLPTRLRRTRGRCIVWGDLVLCGIEVAF